ncbi:MAG TPA: hypothetical protein VFV50_11270, partial [Bdellovibrionales bacterium]|nr:hypothetical protein [Bdellovibrionales bacterium]
IVRRIGLGEIDTLASQCGGGARSMEIISRASTGGYQSGSNVYVTAKVYTFLICDSELILQ